MIHSPAIGVGYFFWRRLRWPLVGLLANIALLAIVARVFAHAEYFLPVVFCTLIPLIFGSVHLLSVFTYGPTDFGSSTSAFPHYMLVQPARARSLVGWPMFYAAVTATFLSVLGYVAVMHGISGNISAALFLGFFVATLAWFQVTAWIPFPFPILRALVLVLIVFGLVAGGIWAQDRRVPTGMIACGYFLSLIVAYLVGVLGVWRARHGEGQTWNLGALFERFNGIFPRRTSFHSARRAQLWYELRRNSIYLPGIMLMTCLPLLLPMLGGRGRPLVIADRTISARLLVMVVVAVMPIFLAAATSGALGKFDFWSNNVPSFTPFFATRAFSTTEFVVTKWFATAISTVVVWMMLLVFVGLFLLTSTASERAQIGSVLGATPAIVIGRVILIFLLLMFVTWRNQVISFFVPMCGRAWFTFTLTMASWLQFSAIAIVGYCAFNFPAVRSAVHSVAPWLIYVFATIKLVMAGVLLRILRQREAVSESQVKKAAIAWAACALALTAILWGICGPSATMIAAAILIAPINRLALAPLALQSNRHR
jgi:hypothetical protein